MAMLFRPSMWILLISGGAVAPQLERQTVHQEDSGWNPTATVLKLGLFCSPNFSSVH